MNAKTRTARVGAGVIWNGTASIGTHLINLARVMVVARLLVPAEFGLFGMAMVVLLGLSALGEFGLKEAFIAYEQESAAERDRWLHAIWTGNLAIKSLLAILLVLAAWPAAHFYQHPELFPMLIVLAAVPVLKALKSPALMLMEKRIAFGQVAAFELAVAIVGFGATVWLAWVTGSAWALVLGQVAGVAGGALFSYAMCRMRPRFVWDVGVIFQALRFGKYLMAVAILTTVTSQFDNLVIGAQLGAAALGIYMIAYRISEVPKLVIASTVGRTLFPYYSEIMSEGRAQLDRAWVAATGYMTWLVLAAYVPIAFFAEYYVVLLFGEQWRGAAPILVILTLLGSLRGVARALNPLLMALRKPSVEAGAKAVETALFIPAVFFGLGLTESAIGVAWAVVATTAVGVACRIVYVIVYMSASPLMLVKRFSRVAAGGAAMAAGGYAAINGQWHALLATFWIWAIWAVTLGIFEPELRRWLWRRRTVLTERLA